MGTEMSDIIGEVISAGSADLDMPAVHRGPVGVRRRPGFVEVAWIGNPSLVRPPITGTLDGAAVEMLSIERSATDQRMMVGTLRMIDQPDA